jgi:transposase
MDISKTDAKVCVRVQGGSGRARNDVTTWGATSSQILELADMLLGEGVTLVVMEATSSYWKPFWHLLTGAGLEVMLVNARQARQIPGRKTDVLDAQWLADLAAHGLLRGSFVPPPPVAQLRDLVRARTIMARMSGQEKQRLEKLMEDTGVKLSSAISKLTTKTGRRMLAAMVAGERDPEALADLAAPNVKASREELVEALTGGFTEHHAYLVKLHLDMIDHCDAQVWDLDERIGGFFDADGQGDGPAGLTPAERADWDAKRDLLETVPGVSRVAAEQILAEIGFDMGVFPDAKRFASWAGTAPGLNESAGRKKGAKARKGDKYLKGALGTAALSVARNPGTFLHSRYARIARRRGPMKALVAVERSMLTSIWHMLTKMEPYRELGADFYDKRKPGAALRKAIALVRANGLDIIPADAVPAAVT